MAILDTSVTGSFNEDRDEEVFIGLDLPIRKSDGVEGYFASTSTTVQAVKNNIKNLLLTNRGERYLQPTIGLNLRKYLFEQFTVDVEDGIKADIVDSLNTWLPFVNIVELRINQNENTLNIYVSFNIRNVPNMVDSVEVSITGD